VVHVDNLEPSKVAQFEMARTNFVGELEKRGVDDRRGLYLKVGETRFYSIVPFESFTALDVLAGARSRAQALMKGTIEEYDRLSDEALVFPHGNEIWSERADLSYLLEGRSLEAAVELVTEDVAPMCDYSAAWSPIAAALASIKHPIERRTFFSGYGTGRTLTFWLAPSLEALRQHPLEAALDKAVGNARAEELLRSLRACVVRSEVKPVRFMREMTVR